MVIPISIFLQESFNRLSYLLDVFTFTQEDMSLNSEVLNWPKNIAPIFDQNDEVLIRFLFVFIYVFFEIFLKHHVYSNTDL